MSAQSKMSKVLNYAEFLLTLFEKLSEQSFYESLLGERLVNLLKRYFGNDFVILSFVFYVSGIVKVKATQLIAQYFQKKKEQERPVVSVQIRVNDFELYEAVAFIVRKQQSRIKNPNLNKLFAAYDNMPYYKFDDEELESESDSESGDQVKELNAPANTRVIQFYPLDGTPNDLFYKGRRVTVMHHEGKVEKTTDDDGYENAEIVGAYWEVSIEGDSMDDLKDLIRQWADIYSNRGNAVPEQTINVYKANSYNWNHLRVVKARSLETVSIKSDHKEKLLQDVRMFKNREKWYTSRGIPHRRGYLLHGPPGTGKTSLIQALAGELKMNLGILNMSEVTSDSGLTEIMQKAPNNMIIVLEDFDRHMSNDGSGNDRFTLAGVLNVLDGIQGQAGSIIVMTCNHIEKIDPAILRPGRMDVKLLLDYADRKQIEDIFWRFFGVDYETMAPVTGKRKQYLQDVQKRFADSIPPMKVTPAELESHFIAVILACDAINLDESEVFDALFEETASFLEKVEQTRAGLGITSFNNKKQNKEGSNDKAESKGKSTNKGDETAENVNTKQEKAQNGEATVAKTSAEEDDESSETEP